MNQDLEAQYRSEFLHEGLTGSDLEDAIRRAVGRSDPRPNNSVIVPALPTVPVETRQPDPKPIQPKLPF